MATSIWGELENLGGETHKQRRMSWEQWKVRMDRQFIGTLTKPGIILVVTVSWIYHPKKIHPRLLSSCPGCTKTPRNNCPRPYVTWYCLRGVLMPHLCCCSFCLRREMRSTWWFCLRNLLPRVWAFERTASCLQNSFNLRHAKAGLATCTIYYLILNTSWYFMYYKRDWMHIWYTVFSFSDVADLL